MRKKWEISFIEFQNRDGKKYKVTRRIPELYIAETKMFTSKQEAKEQINIWLE